MGIFDQTRQQTTIGHACFAVIYFEIPTLDNIKKFFSSQDRIKGRRQESTPSRATIPPARKNPSRRRRSLRHQQSLPGTTIPPATQASSFLVPSIWYISCVSFRIQEHMKPLH